MNARNSIIEEIRMYSLNPILGGYEMYVGWGEWVNLPTPIIF